MAACLIEARRERIDFSTTNHMDECQRQLITIMQEPIDLQTTKTSRKRKFSVDDCSPNDGETKTNLIDNSCAIQSVPFAKTLAESNLTKENKRFNIVE